MDKFSTKSLPISFSTSAVGLLDQDDFPILPTLFRLKSISARSAVLSWNPSASNPELLAYYVKMNGDKLVSLDEALDDNIDAPIVPERAILYQVLKSKKGSLVFQAVYQGNEMACTGLDLIPEQDYEFKIRLRWEDTVSCDPAYLWSKEFIIVEGTTTDEVELNLALEEIFKIVTLDDPKPIRHILDRFKNDFRIDQCDKEGRTVAEIVCKSGAGEIMDVLLKAGADKNHATLSGKTLVSIAATHFNVSVLDSLLKYGADVNLADNGGSTPLMWACQYSSSNEVIPIIKLLINMKDIDLNAQDHYGLTAFDRLCQQTRGELLIAKMLVDRGSRILHDPQKPHNMNSLMMAAQSGNEQVCMYLVSKKVLVSTRNCHDHGAVDFARAKGFPELAKTLGLIVAKEKKT